MTDTIVRGDTAVWDILLVYGPDHPQAGQPMNLTGATVWVTAKLSPQMPDEQAAWRHTMVVSGAGAATSSNGLALGAGGATSGHVVETLTSAESAPLVPGVTYGCDVQVREASGAIHTPILGQEITVKPDYTHATTVS